MEDGEWMAGKMGTAVVQCLYNHPQGSTVCSRTHLTMTWANTVRPYGVYECK